MPRFQRIYWSEKFDWKEYSRLYDRYAKSSGNFYVQSASALIGSAPLKRDAKAIDLACGTGVLTSLLVEKYPKMGILGVDLSKEMLALYRRNFTGQIKTSQVKAMQGNAEKIGRMTKEKHDAVFINCALWDLEIEKTFSGIAKVLNKGGLLAFNLPSLVLGREKGFVSFIESFFRQELNSTAVYRRISMDYAKRALEKYGFWIESMKEYELRLSRQNIGLFFELLRYRWPFVFFPRGMQYEKKLELCKRIFDECYKHVPAGGMKDYGFSFVLRKK
ncbi:MAG: methyltransferase domain-containing protein [Candidatus Aenigmarchaeota archaeon]|nr:methyltransferase domain-containing protein [Candidatus Aenigmarchaeota archaeon]